MASFGQKLARLVTVREPTVPFQAERPVIRGEPALARGEPDPSSTLEALRARIALILADPGLRPGSVSGQSVGQGAPRLSGFAREETALGPLDVLRKPTPLGHRVGAAPVAFAPGADVGLLALLALDPILSTCDLRRALYLDTETTGLSGGTGTLAFLLGLGSFEDRVHATAGEAHGGFVIEQLLLREPGQEAPMLEHLRTRLEDASMIVTFNGKAFDMPLLRTRAVMNRLAPLPERPHLDLLHVARRVHRYRLAQKNLVRIEEDVLGFGRVGDVAGAEVAACYHHYLRTGDDSALVPVVEHNSLDVISMIALVGLYGEPVSALSPEDLAAMALVMKRAGDLERASGFAETSVARGGGARAFKVRGDIAKARGDKALALQDYERALSAVLPARAEEPSSQRSMSASNALGDDAMTQLAPSLRLELAKLYEHHARAFGEALTAIEIGTTESPAAHARRVERLSKKALRVGKSNGRAPARPRSAP